MVWYQRGRHIVMDPNTASGLGETPLNLLLDIIRIALMKTTYSINVDTHEQFDDIAASEIVADNYAARGDAIQLGTKAIARNDGADQVEFDAADHTYVGIGHSGGGTNNDTFDQIVVMREQDAGATDANTELIGHVGVGSTTTNGGDVTLVFAGTGLLQLTA